ncbi:MAG: acetate/propionate family kinase [Proteobacteria bacterium]|nr:acetate/propionate family kinase [Pseudomonadota bacterium]
MNDVVLVINGGSSSLKFAVYAVHAVQTVQPVAPALQRIAHGQVSSLAGAAPKLAVWGHDDALLTDEPVTAPSDRTQVHDSALAHALRWLAAHRGRHELVAVGHRVVHGGQRLRQPVRITPDILDALAALEPLAPLHQPRNLAAVRAMSRLQPALPQVACFDTAFHVTQPPVAQAFALPDEPRYADIKRYGFHGLSYEYIASVLPQHLGAARADRRVVVAHLGNGASLCGLKQRRSVATTMGFTATDGLMMGTRCGSLDPGVVLYLIAQLGMRADEVQTLLNERSGLLGVSGLSSDMRTLEASGTPQADAAIELFCYRITRELGSLAAALGGLDALVFTGGIGEHSARVRERVCRDARWLGIKLDDESNRRGAVCISTPTSRVAVNVIATDEEQMIARHVCALLGVRADVADAAT